MKSATAVLGSAYPLMNSYQRASRLAAIGLLALLAAGQAAAQQPSQEFPPPPQRPAVDNPAALYPTGTGTRWIEDGDFVYGARLAGFDLPAYLRNSAPQLQRYADDISHWAGFYSINPLVLLAVMDMRSGVMSSAAAASDPFTGLVAAATPQEQVRLAFAALYED